MLKICFGRFISFIWDFISREKDLMFKTRLGVFLVFLWEFIGFKADIIYKPSIFLESVAVHLARFFKWCGNALVYLSSFYTYIETLAIYIKNFLADIFTVIGLLIVPIWKILTSWLWIILGYIEAVKLYTHPALIAIGSLTLFSIVIYLLIRYHVFVWLYTKLEPICSRHDFLVMLILTFSSFAIPMTFLSLMQNYTV